ncbi:E3 binding domain-containing protein, partial [Haladaptatus sp.]|uniref:E3 binding domain-containing protein n=1 Tax=Haladaptatus sp. TaxID=1973141 RepID=UPI003C5F5D62
MAYVVKMPKLGLEMDSGTLNAWTVSVGDTIKEGATIAEIESEKTTAEIDAREDGVLRRIFVEEGDVTDPGAPLGIVAAPDADIDELIAEVEGESTAVEDEPSSESATAAAAGDDGQGASVQRQSTSASAASVKATPRAKRRAEELGVDLTTVDGTGPQGAVDEADVEAVADSEAAAGETAESDENVKATPRAKRRAEELGVALHDADGTGPQGAVTEADVEAVAAASEPEPAAAESTDVGPSGATEPDVPSERVFATPSARRLARELGVDVESIETPDNGRLTETDVRRATGDESAAVEAATEEPSDEATTVPGTRQEDRPLSGMRRTIADRLG